MGANGKRKGAIAAVAFNSPGSRKVYVADCCRISANPCPMFAEVVNKSNQLETVLQLRNYSKYWSPSSQLHLHRRLHNEIQKGLHSASRILGNLAARCYMEE